MSKTITAVGCIVKWRGDEVLAAFEKRVAANLDRASLLVVRDVVTHFGNPPREPNKKGTGFKKNSSRIWKRAHRSTPGDPPYIQTGTLKRSIGFDRPTKLTRRVGSSLKGAKGKDGKAGRSYAHMLEYGTTKMAARPYLRPALMRQRSAIIKELSK